MIEGIREWMRSRAYLVQIGIGVIVLSIVVYLLRDAFPGSSGGVSKAYFSDDDGVTQFVDSAEHFVPFDHNGKQAYRAWVFSTDGGKTTFVGYLERYTPQAKERLISELRDFKAGKTHMPPDVRPSDAEVKKPGVGNPWVSRGDMQKAQQILKLNVPASSSLDVQLPS